MPRPRLSCDFGQAIYRGQSELGLILLEVSEAWVLRADKALLLMKAQKEDTVRPLEEGEVIRWGAKSECSDITKIKKETLKIACTYVTRVGLNTYVSESSRHGELARHTSNPRGQSP